MAGTNWVTSIQVGTPYWVGDYGVWAGDGLTYECIADLIYPVPYNLATDPVQVADNFPQGANAAAYWVVGASGTTAAVPGEEIVIGHEYVILENYTYKTGVYTLHSFSTFTPGTVNDLPDGIDGPTIWDTVTPPTGGGGGGTAIQAMFYKGEWDAASAYIGTSGENRTDVVSYNGAAWVCWTNNTGEAPGTNPATWQPLSGGGTYAAPTQIMKFKGFWQDGVQYAAGDTNYFPFMDVVVGLYDFQYVCIQDHTSDFSNIPGLEGSDWELFWMLVPAGPVSGAAAAEQKSFLGGLVDGVFDWMKTATIGDWLGAIAIGAGVIIAGSAIIDAMTKDGTPSGDAAGSKYTGSPSFTGTYTPPSLRSVVISICTQAGIENYDASLLSDTETIHFSLSQVTSIRNILDNMSKAFQFDMVDSNGILKFVPRNSNVVRDLTHVDMGFNSSGDVVAPVTMKRLQSVDLPRSVTLTYIAEDLDYANYSQKSEIATFVEGNDVNLAVPFMLTHAMAKESCDKLLIGAHLERMQYTFKTSYVNAIDLEPGDIITIPEGYVRIAQIEEVDEGVLEIHCVDAGALGPPTPIIVGGVTIGYTANTYIGTGLAPQLPGGTTNVALDIGESSMFVVDPPTLDSVDTEPRVYFAVHGYGRKNWPGAHIFKSYDGGESYSLIGSATKEASWGIVETVPAPSSALTIDTTTVINVKLKTGQLISITDTALLAGANKCMIGHEVVQFGVATLIGDKEYALSRLLRGRHGSEWAMDSHVVNELFVLMDDSLIKMQTVNAERNNTYKYKIVTVGSDLSKVNGMDVQILGNNLVPWTVSNLAFTKTGSDYNLTWLERPRFLNSITSYNEVAHDPDWGGYAVVVYNGTAVVRQQIVMTPFWTYTSAMQVTDFGADQAHVTITVTQVSNKYGGGRPTSITT